MTNAPTLLDLVHGLEPVLLRHLAGIRISFDGERAEALLSISLYTDSTRGVQRACTHAWTDGLPAGVHITGRERWPDIIREVTTAEPIDAQIVMRQNGRTRARTETGGSA